MAGGIEISGVLGPSGSSFCQELGRPVAVHRANLAGVLGTFSTVGTLIMCCSKIIIFPMQCSTRNSAGKIATQD